MHECEHVRIYEGVRVSGCVGVHEWAGVSVV